jgi:arylsulfatase A-like enzyme
VDGSRTAAGIVRLLDRLEYASVEHAPDSSRFEALAPIQPDEFVIRDDFEGPSLGAEWSVGIRPTETSNEPARLEKDPPPYTFAGDPSSGETVLAFATGAGGLHRIVPAPHGHALVVVARMRATRLEPALPTGFLVEPLTMRPTPDWVPGDPLFRLQLLPPWVDQLDRWSASLDSARSGEWETLRLVVKPHLRLHAMRLVLRSGPGGALVDFVEVRSLRIGAPEHVGSAEPAAGVEPFVRRRHQVATEWSDALLLPTGTAISFRVGIPEGNPRLDAWIALAEGRASGRAEIRLEISGMIVAARRVDAASGETGASLTPWIVDLSTWAGRDVVLTFRAADDGNAVGLVASPTILANVENDVRPSVVVISLDTLRADSLGCYGAPGDPTPVLDGLAARGTVFEDVVTPSSWTLPAHASLLTSVHPIVHGAVTPDRGIRDAVGPSLPERLQAAGYRTAAFTGGGFVHPDFGLARGVDLFSVRDPGGAGGRLDRDRDESAAASDSTDREERILPVLHWIERNADRPFFVLLHTYVVHNYHPAPEFFDPTRDPCPSEVLALDGKDLWDRADESGDVECARHLRHLYDATVAQADRWIVGRLLESLERLGLRDRTIVAVVSDHGEEFLEHGRMSHGRSLFGEVVQVPWILSGPGVGIGTRRADAVNLLDVAPTILKLVGVDADAAMEGRDVLATREARPDREHVLDLEVWGMNVHWSSLRTGEWRILRRTEVREESTRVYLFRRDRAGGESVDLVAEEPGRCGVLLERMDRALAELAAEGARLGEASGDAAELAPELVERLEALGYAGE